MTALDVKVALVPCPIHEQERYPKTYDPKQELEDRAEDGCVPWRLLIRDITG